MTGSVDLNTIAGAMGLLMGGGGIWSFLASRAKSRGDLITIAQDAAEGMIKSMREEIQRVTARCERAESRCDQLEEQDDRCRHELASLKRAIEVLGQADVSMSAQPVDGEQAIG